MSKKKNDPFRTLDDPEPAAAPAAAEYVHAGAAGSAEVSRLVLGERCFLTMPGPRPNAWYRFWARVLLGWKWEKV